MTKNQNESDLIFPSKDHDINGPVYSIAFLHANIDYLLLKLVFIIHNFKAKPLLH